MKKEQRHQLIVDILTNHVIRTQEELLQHLKEHGVTATQATISRDLNDLKVIKATMENGEKYLAKIDKIKQLAKANKGDQKPVFVSEPVFDYALQGAGYKIGDKKFEEAIENGTDPSPKTINEMNNAIKQKKIAFFVNNTQASSSTVKSFVKLAKKNNIPVLNVRETIPNNTTYLAWMKENYQKLADIQNN